MAPRSVGCGSAAAFGYLGLVLSCLFLAFGCPTPHPHGSPRTPGSDRVTWNGRKCRDKHRCRESGQVVSLWCFGVGQSNGSPAPTPTAMECWAGNWEAGHHRGSPVRHKERQQACRKGRFPRLGPGPLIFILHSFLQIMQPAQPAVALR